MMLSSWKILICLLAIPACGQTDHSSFKQPSNALNYIAAQTSNQVNNLERKATHIRPPSRAANKCEYYHGNNNSQVDYENNILNCLRVHEFSDISTSLNDLVCNFLATDAVTLELIGELATYNVLPSVNNGNGSLAFGLQMIEPYCPIVDTATPNLNPSAVLKCTDIDGVTADIPIYVHIIEENTQFPEFEAEEYAFLGLPNNLPPGIDFATSIYGAPIYAADKDNIDIDPTLSYIIQYTIESNDTDLFQVQAVLDEQTYPKRFRAAISIQKEFDPSIRVYQFKLYANNSIPNVVGEQAASALVTVELN